jgi:hypothetical protein
VPRPDLGLPRGAVGTVVDVYTKPRLGYEVEFLDDQHRTIAVESLPADAVESLEPGEVAPPDSRQ